MREQLRIAAVAPTDAVAAIVGAIAHITAHVAIAGSARTAAQLRRRVRLRARVLRGGAHKVEHEVERLEQRLGRGGLGGRQPLQLLEEQRCKAGRQQRGGPRADAAQQRQRVRLSRLGALA